MIEASKGRVVAARAIWLSDLAANAEVAPPNVTANAASMQTARELNAHLWWLNSVPSNDENLGRQLAYAVSRSGKTS